MMFLGDLGGLTIGQEPSATQTLISMCILPVKDYRIVLTKHPAFVDRGIVCKCALVISYAKAMPYELLKMLHKTCCI